MQVPAGAMKGSSACWEACALDSDTLVRARRVSVEKDILNVGGNATYEHRPTEQSS